jgi:hypothetical protein
MELLQLMPKDESDILSAVAKFDVGVSSSKAIAEVLI